MSDNQSYSISSPDKKIETEIEISDKIKYSIWFNGEQILEPSSLAMSLDNGKEIGRHPNLAGTKRRFVDDVIYPVVRQKNAEIADRYNECTLLFHDGYQVIFRVSNDGIAYRFVTDLETDRVRVQTEQVQVNFTGNFSVYFPGEESFMTQYEKSYEYTSLADISSDQFGSLPLLVEIKNGTKILITEADLEDYPGLYLRGTGTSSLSGIFPHVAIKGEMNTKEEYKITERANYIAETNGSRKFPWRVFVITERDADLVENEMVYKLASPLQLKDTSWIKPGKATWNWWHNQNIYNVDFRAGVNMSTYKYYIDFASRLGLEYLVIDETWYELRDLPDVNPDIDTPGLVEYGRRNNVGIILWITWKDLEDNWETAFELFTKWNIAGIKPDFMKRDDQWMVNWYRKVAKEAAKRKLLVNFHGAFKPTGLRRAYPNVITREAVKGLEQVKGLEGTHPDWSDDMTPRHDVTLPFIRMAVGPMDYTPGAMVNAQPKNFRAIDARPLSQGTRCHQLAMYVVYECPLQMLADSPTHYLEQKNDILKYLSDVPVTWDKTVVPDAKVGEYILVAREKENRWYLAAMTNEEARSLEVNLSFLEENSYQAEIFSDGMNADSYAEDYRYTVQKVTRNSSIIVDMKQGGGWVAVLTPDDSS